MHATEITAEQECLCAKCGGRIPVHTKCEQWAADIYCLDCLEDSGLTGVAAECVRISERFAPSPWRRLLDALWTILVGVVAITCALTILRCIVVEGFDFLKQPLPNLQPEPSSGLTSFMALVAGCTTALVVPMCLICVFCDLRPTLIRCDGKRLVAKFGKKLLRMPFEHCEWRIGHIWNLDSAGARLHFKPYLLVTYTSESSVADKASVRRHVIACGLTPKTFRFWRGLFLLHRMPQRDPSRAIMIVLHTAAGSIVGAAVGVAGLVVLSGVGVHLPHPWACVAVGSIDGLAAGICVGVCRFASIRTLARLQAEADQGQRLIMIAFALLGMRLMRGMGLGPMLLIAAANALIGSTLWVWLIRILRKRMASNHASAECFTFKEEA